MNKIKGLVVKTEGSWMWVATEDRRFRRFPLLSNSIKPGMEVLVDSNRVNTSRSHLPKVLAASIVFLLLLGTVINIVFDKTTIAYVAIDINPSLELAINSENKVAEAIPLNEDAKLFLHSISLKGKDVWESLNIIMEKAQKDGFISPEKDNTVLITVINIKGDTSSLPPSGIKNLISNRMNEENLPGSAGIMTASLEDREKARQEGLSLNSYLIREKAARRGIPGFSNISQKETADMVNFLIKEGMLNDLFDEIEIIPKKERENLSAGLYPSPENEMANSIKEDLNVPHATNKQNQTRTTNGETPPKPVKPKIINNPPPIELNPKNTDQKSSPGSVINKPATVDTALPEPNKQDVVNTPAINNGQEKSEIDPQDEKMQNNSEQEDSTPPLKPPANENDYVVNQGANSIGAEEKEDTAQANGQTGGSISGGSNMR